MARPLNILFVEDSASDLQLMVRIIRKAGIEVSFEQAESQSEMLDALSRGSWDLVISDCNLPGFSGSEALQTLRSINSAMPFLAVSSTLDERVCASMMEAGASSCLVKNSLFSQLIANLYWLMDWPAVPEPGDWDANAFDSCQAVFGEAEFTEYIARVMDSARSTLKELERLYERENLASMVDISHRLKSPCANIGAQALARVMGEVETAGAGGRIAALPALLSEAWTKYAEFLHFLKERGIELPGG